MDLFFDTETTGLPDKFLTNDHPSQPRLVQLGALLCDGREIRSRVDLIFRPETSIPPKVVAIHGITDSMALNCGVHPLIGVFLFTDLVGKANRIIAHNVDFDAHIMDIAFARYGKEIVYPEMFCTQQAAMNTLKIPGKEGFKRPTLMETYKYFVDPNGFENAHSAYADAMACAQIYWAMQKE